VPLVDLRPFLTGEGTLTTVSAKSAVFTSEAAISTIKLFAPNALTDKLQPEQVVRHHLTARMDRAAITPLSP
jgi:hypothetical protein